MNATIDLLSAHRSVRKFKDTPVDDTLLHTIVKAAQCAATSNHVQAYTIVRVQDKENRRQIANLAGPQLWVEQAPLFLVFCADLTRLEAACGQTCKDYYLNRDSNLKDQTWNRQMANFMGKISRPHMKSFLEKRGFFLK